MTPQMHADVWTLHLTRILRAHPEFTPGQRSLIHEGLGLIASGIFEIDRSSREWTVEGRQTLRDFSNRVNAAFPPEIARALMSDPRDTPSCWPYHTCGPWMADTCDGVCYW